jgi:hypothetical protein
MGRDSGDNRNLFDYSRRHSLSAHLNKCDGSADFRPYAVPVALGTLAIGFGFACAGSAFRRTNQMMTRLTAATSLGCVEVLAWLETCISTSGTRPGL